MSDSNETVILDDGSIVKVPGRDNMSEGEITNALIKALPGKMAGLGFLPDMEREYNIRDGVPDLNLRFQEALTAGNPKEIKAVFDDQVGPGNWGIDPASRKPFVTPQGLRNLGIEPKDDRKVFLDGTSTDIYDLTADATREIAIGAATVAAELALPFVPGSFLLGLGARAGAAGAGGTVASLGLEGLQELQGYNKESAVEVLKNAGTEGAFIGAATFVLGAPFAAYGSIANRVKAAAKEVDPDAPPVTNTTVTEMVEAQQKVEGRVGKENAMLLSIRTVIGEDGAIIGNLLSKLEGIGAKQAGDEFAARAGNIINKYKNTYLASIRAGDDEIVTLGKLKTVLSKDEQDMLVKAVRSIKNFDETAFGKVGAATQTLNSFKNFTHDKLTEQYRAGQKAFDSPEYYGQFDVMKSRAVTNNELATLLNSVSKQSKVLIDDVVNSVGPGNPLHTRITSRVKINENTGRAEAAKGGEGTAITAGDLLEADRRMRQKSYKSSSPKETRENLEMSKHLLDQIEQLNIVPKGFKKKLQKVNSEYSQFVTPYRGKDGLFAQIAQRGEQDAQKYLISFFSGKGGSDFTKIMDDLDKAFGSGAIGNKLGLDGKDEILSAIGMNFIRENKVDIVDAIASGKNPSTVARRTLEQIGEIEKTIKKRMNGGVKSKKTLNQIFKGNVLTEYKKLLKDVVNGRPAQVDKALAELGMTMSFKEAGQFVKSVNSVAMNLSKSDLDSFATQLRALEEVSPDSAKFVRDMLFTDNYSRLFKAVEAQDPKARLLGIKQWADDWSAATLNNAENMRYIFGKELFEGVDDFALNMKGALNIDPVAGALSVAEDTVGLFRKAISLSIGALQKPLAFIYFTRRFAPGTAVHTKVVQGLQSGKTAAEITKEQSGAALKMMDKAQDYAKGVMNARDGLVAASIANYLGEVNQASPTEDEVPTVRPQKIQVQQEAPQPATQGLPQDVGIAAIQQIAQMLGGTGEAALAQGAAMAKGR